MDDATRLGRENAYQVTRHIEGCEVTEWGLTKREYFAAIVTQGFCANAELWTRDPNMIAKWGVEQADALLRALSAPPANERRE